jgi:hypothetical protein
MALENLLQATQVGELDAGKLGELATRIILLLAFDAARSGSDLYTGAVSLSTFLGTLVGSDDSKAFFATDDDDADQNLAEAWREST